MEEYSTEQIEIDGRTKTRYQWSQEMRRLESAVRQQKDTATLAKAAGDTQLERRCKGTILQMNEKYKTVAEQAGLKPEFQRTFVQGYRDGKVELTAGVPYDIQLRYSRMTGNNEFSRTAKRTNPHFAEGPEYQKNCTHCVIAYEMRRRGYDVIASPVILDAQNNISPKDTIANGFGYVKAFENATNELCIKTDDRQQVIDRMNRWGDGARAIVRIVWSGRESEPGHVFIAEQINGKTYFIDPQNGAFGCEDYFTRSRKGTTMIMRVDNRKTTDVVNEAVLPRDKEINDNV